ncbi:hypothetical protein [Oscillibacter sp.]|uniref:hypothetical protein n=1 Tax=Oscillibacter sp. TaxID=1945593 RepID=UPI002896538F|nr:hypothetical protein [Oscillibacter sp.]
MSKFDQGCFGGGYDDFAVSKEKYTKDQAIAIAIDNIEPCHPKDEEWILCVGDCWVRHRAGVNEDGEPQVGWWLEYSEHTQSCPAWCFHVGKLNQRNGLSRGYEKIRVARGAAQAGEGENAE